MTRGIGVGADADNRIAAKPNNLLELDLAVIPILPPSPHEISGWQFESQSIANFRVDTSSIETDVPVQDNQVSVTNKSPELPVAFYFYPAKSTFVAGNPPDITFTSCYQSSKKVWPTSVVTFTVKRFLGDGTKRPVVFVITGTAKTNMTPGIPLLPNSAILLTLSDGSTSSARDSTCIMTKPDDSEPSFSRDAGGRGPKAVDPPNPTGAVPAGCVRILMDSSFTGGDKDIPYVGLAMLDPDSKNSVIPVFTWVASPGTTVNIKPNAAWICAKGDTQGAGIPRPGSIIDTSSDPPNIKLDLPDPRVDKELSFADNKFSSVNTS